MDYIKNYKQNIISHNKSIMNASKQLDGLEHKILFVTKRNNEYLGSVTDGDIRRSIFNNIPSEEKIFKITNTKSKFFYNKEKNIQNRLSSASHSYYPILNNKNNIIKILEIGKNQNIKESKLDVLIMAGGFGKRLMPITKKTPKPMIKINGKPMLERLIENIKKYNLKNFYISVNYLKKQIIEYFKNGKKHGIKIKYIQETKPLGTAGCLGFFKKKINEDLLVINCDVSSNINLLEVYKYHKKKRADFTAVVTREVNKIPFGVVITSKKRIVQIKEKPEINYDYLSGIYIINKKILDKSYIKNKINMDQYMNKLIKDKKKVLSYMHDEYWADLGTHESLKKNFSTSSFSG